MHSSWYKNAIVYSLDVETFFDSNADGIGDFQGLIRKLDYLASLGITCLWLLPFYPSPNRDNGYDVMDYYNIDPRLGTLGDFTEFIQKSQDNGIRVIVDLVVNHSSIEHPWFQEARQDANSRYRQFYIWSDIPLPYNTQDLVFAGEEDTMWSYDEVAGQYYLHRFYKEQPDLNIGNPEVRKEILKIMGFWLKLGVSGFRIDAAEILIEPYGLSATEEADLVTILEEMREYINARKNDAILLAETNIYPDRMKTYLDEGRRMHMLFSFFVNQYLFLSVATEDPAPLVKSLLDLPDVHPSNQWLNFLRHHDELTLSLLSEQDKHRIFDRFAPEQHMQIYNRGIRRRLAPMLDWNVSLLKLMNSLMFSIPGIPLIRYGDEIAMGDDLSLEGRNSVRTLMQWSALKNGGFSDAAPEDLVKPLIRTGECGYESINVVESQKNPDSFFNWLKRLIATRRQCTEIGHGVMEIIELQHTGVLAHKYVYNDEQVLLLHNFSSQKIEISKNIPALPRVSLSELLTENCTVGNDTIVMQGFGFAWLKVFD